MGYKKLEDILMSSTVFKYNFEGTEQERVMMITNKNIFNIIPYNIFGDVLANLITSVRVKRKIPLELVKSITMSRFGCEFIVHVPSEYDYRYSCERRDQLISVLMIAYLHKTKQ